MLEKNVMTMDRLMSPSVTLATMLENPPPGLQPIANKPNANSLSSCRRYPKPKATCEQPREEQINLFWLRLVFH